MARTQGSLTIPAARPQHRARNSRRDLGDKTGLADPGLAADEGHRALADLGRRHG
jgi:hypothetical protein